MEERFADTLNELLVDTYRNVNKVEEAMLRSTSGLDLTIGELHLIETVAQDGARGRTISQIAQRQELTLPSVTVAVNKLVKKGYVEKVRCEDDGRRVYVRVTEKGRRADAVHRYFHRQMVRSVLKEIDPKDHGALLRCLSSLNAFFHRRAQEMQAAAPQ